MEAMEGELEIKVISAKHLWAFNFFQKLRVYAWASVSGQEQRTPADPDGDGHPEWNHPMSFDLSDLPSPADHFLRFQLRHHAGLPFPDRTIGEVRVPLSDLLHPSNATFRFVDYQIRSPDDKPNGVLHFAYKLNRIGAGAHSPLALSGYPQIENPPSLYPAADQWEDSHTPAPANLSYSSPPPPTFHPPPPYWPHPPPPPPPGHPRYPWSYHHQTQGQYNNGR